MLSREHLWCSGRLFDITFASMGLKAKNKADDSEARPLDDAALCCLRVTSRVLEASLIKINVTRWTRALNHVSYLSLSNTHFV